MKQWDIWTCDFADAGPHLAVIVSHPDRVARAPLVNVLIGSSQKASRPARENEVVLNSVDGLGWETLVKCDLVSLVEKESWMFVAAGGLLGLGGGGVVRL